MVINGEEIITTEMHPFYVNNRGFVNAGELAISDELLDSNCNVLLVENHSVELTDEPTTVYNFQVEDFHTYHVSGFGVLVHNAGKDYSRRERMGRQKGKSPRDQKKQQKQVKAITRELKRRGVPENKIKDNIHDILHDEGMDYQEALEEALNYFGV
ncbi:polymorphic toxin-type HINT domain-containing protein [Ruminococcus sp. MSJ-25]|uniref:polymorphic toxin-type HINT domain-containing protein n=1 Tax=Ruminococcus sp. MSJ-25 TaxID=2841536 RepID=UPI00209FBF0A|nr:polymorphic toxin-type HINT domain-containing protein [Ruminococcus sp. MSJ-25]